MAMGLLGGLSGMSHCHQCNSSYCHHVMQGMAAQQQMGMSQYHDYISQQMRAAQMQQQASKLDILAGSVSESEVKKTDIKKKLLLLLR